MQKYRLCIFTLTASALACTLLTASEPQTGDDILKQIQGTWKFVTHEMDGKSATKDELAKMKITFAGNKFSISDNGKVVQEGNHKFDPSKKPGQVDATITEGEGKGTTMLGLFELTGDSLKVCFDEAGKQRPTTFAAKGATVLNVTVQREKK